MISKSQRKHFESVLQAMFSGLAKNIKLLADKLGGKKTYFGDADFSLEPVRGMTDYSMFTEDELKSYSALLLDDLSSGWWAHLETGLGRHNRPYLLIYAAQSQDSPPEKYEWKQLYDSAMSGKPETDIMINATYLTENNLYGEKPGSWYDPIPFIDFSHPLCHTINSAMFELGMISREELLNA